MRAAASGNTDVCRELYNAGANPNIIEPKTGRTALHFCAEFDQAQVNANIYRLFVELIVSYTDQRFSSKVAIIVTNSPLLSL